MDGPLQWCKQILFALQSEVKPQKLFDDLVWVEAIVFCNLYKLSKSVTFTTIVFATSFTNRFPDWKSL